MIATHTITAAVARDPRLVLIAPHTMDAVTLHAVTSACARAHARTRVWSEGVALDALPALVVAALPAGVRHIPDGIIDLADRRFPGTPLLLTCNEPLTRPTITLQAGRLTLVEPPLTQARVVSRVRLLLADEAHDDTLELAPPQLAPGALRSRELRQRLWWAAELACAGRALDRATVVAPPRACIAGDHTLTALLLPTGADAPPDVERALEIVRHGAHQAEDAAALEDALGRGVGLLHLTRQAQDWIIYWPCHQRPLWLFSPLRLPRWSDLTASQSASLWHMPAASGDVVAAMSSRALFAGPPPTEASSAMLDGGPALLELLEARLGAAPQPWSCVLVEVR
jgi:hypothetical protein